MSKGAKQVLGIVAAVAIPFAAPAIAGALATSAAAAGWAGTASFLAGAGGAAATGAALGGLSAAATGGDPLTGAALGGLGGFAGGGGFNSLFGAPATTTTAPVSGSMPSALRPMARPAGLAVPGAATTAATAAGASPTAAAAAGGAAAPTGLSGFFQSVAQGALSNPAGVAQLAMTVFGRPPQNLTAAEQAQLQDLQRVAAQNMDLFETQVSQANNLLRMAEQQAPNPQQAYAETKIAAERQLGEQTRGLGAGEAAFAQRRAGIRSAQAGATAAAAEEARGRQAQVQLTQAGLAALPAQAPQGYAGLAMPTYNDLQQRRDEYYRDLATASGDLFGNIA